MPKILLSTGEDGPSYWETTTWNPTTGCDRVSPGCDHCYALAFAARLKEMGQSKYQRDGNARSSGPGFGLTLHPETLGLPRTWKRPRHVFVGSMSDLFHPSVPLEYVQQVVATMRVASQHTFQVLTKRARRLAELSREIEWPDNVWLGTSVENERQLHRAADLRRVNAAMRYLSLEPLLGPLTNLPLDGIHWITVAGESGPGCRPMDADWARDIRDQTRRANVPFFFVQWGGVSSRSSGRLLDGRTWDERPAQNIHASC